MTATKQDSIANGTVGGIRKFDIIPMTEKPPKV
jgi:hypothetical protein